MTLVAMPPDREATAARPAATTRATAAGATDPTRAAGIDAAAALATTLADLAREPAAFARELRSGLEQIGDPDYAARHQAIAPGLETTLGIRLGVANALERTLVRELAGVRMTTFLDLADALLRDGRPEERWLAIALLHRTVGPEPELTWQLLRRAARAAHEWITVDALAHPVGAGILAERYRWAELEQLVYSPSRWERRLVGSTIATIPFVDRELGRRPDVAERGLELIRELIGDAEPDVQRSLSWALRSLTLVDPEEVVGFCRQEADASRRTGDGHRAWVVRDALPKLPAAPAATIRATLAGTRKRAGSPATSRASAIAADFALPDPARHPEPPLR